MCATWRDSINTYSQLIRWSPLQWIIVALVKPLNVVAIEALVTDLHPGTQRAHGRKFLDGEPDRLGCGRKAAIAQLLSPTLALAHEQFGGYAVVECHSSRSAGFAFMLNPITEIDRKGLFGRQASARTTTTPGITTLLTIGNIAARLLFLRLTFRPLARLAQNEEPAKPERIKESSCLPWGNASRLNARIASNRAGRRH